MAVATIPRFRRTLDDVAAAQPRGRVAPRRPGARRCVGAVAVPRRADGVQRHAGPGESEPYDTTFLKRQALFVVLGPGGDGRHRRHRLPAVPGLGAGALRRRCRAARCSSCSPLGSERRAPRPGSSSGRSSSSRRSSPSSGSSSAWPRSLAQFRGEIDLRRLRRCCSLARRPPARPDHAAARPRHRPGARRPSPSGAARRRASRPRTCWRSCSSARSACGLVLNSNLLEEYQKDRLTSFLDQQAQAPGARPYNLDQSKIAIGAGGLFGQGPVPGHPDPARKRARAAHRLHLHRGRRGARLRRGRHPAGAVRDHRVAHLAERAAGPRPFGTLVCVGVLAMFLFQIFENVGMTMGIMPITGIPLPFVCYGGSATIADLRRHRPGPQRPHAPLLLTPTPVLRASFRVAAPDICHRTGAGESGNLRVNMSSIWPQLEPLLARVQKPARYIGCEDGAVVPRARPGTSVLAARVPRHLRDRAAQPGPADPLRDPERAARRRGRAGRTPPGPTSRRCCGRARCRCSRSTPTGRPASSTSSPSTCRPSSSTPTSSTASTWPACRSGPPTARPEHPLIGAGGHCTFNPEPLADFVDFFVHGRRRRGRRRDHRGRRGVEAQADGPIATTVLRDLAADPRRVRAVDVRRALRRRRPRRGDATLPRRARAGREAHHRRPRRVAVPQAPAGAAHRGRPRPPQRRGLPGLHPRLPLLPGRHDHPPGARAAGRAGAHHGHRRAAAHRLRRGGAHVPVDRRLLRHRGGRGRDRRAPATTPPPAATSA